MPKCTSAQKSVKGESWYLYYSIRVTEHIQTVCTWQIACNIHTLYPIIKRREIPRGLLIVLLALSMPWFVTSYGNILLKVAITQAIVYSILISLKNSFSNDIDDCNKAYYDVLFGKFSLMYIFHSWSIIAQIFDFSFVNISLSHNTETHPALTLQIVKFGGSTAEENSNLHTQALLPYSWWFMPRIVGLCSNLKRFVGIATIKAV